MAHVGDWKLKHGQWVIAGNPPGVGIIHQIGPESSTVHFVDENGETIDSQVVPNASLRRARMNDIPEKRRGDFQETLNQLRSNPPSASMGGSAGGSAETSFQPAAQRAQPARPAQPSQPSQQQGGTGPDGGGSAQQQGGQG